MNLIEDRFNNLSPLKKALFKIEKYKAELENLTNSQKTEDIAIVGMALEFPNAKNPTQFWNNIINKKDAIKAFPESRKKKLKDYYKSKNISLENVTFQEGAYLRSIDRFDNEFFNIPLSSAITTHPLQRLFLQTSWKALENAGHLQNEEKKVGVFFGTSGDIINSQYLDIIERSESDLTPASLMGNTSSVASSKLSYFMDFTGPAISIDTACSSSLVAVHQACNSLLNRESNLAIAGGGKLYLLPEKDKYNVGFESPTGRTKPFDNASDGAGIGEGVAAIVLKRLDDAVKDNDQIYAVIKGTAVNQDGTSSGLVAPNPQAQTEVIKEAAKRAGIDLETLEYIETHGTGTKLGDPIEFQGLRDAFKETSNKQFCALGSVKSNIGHLFEAAGIAGLIKCVLSLQHKTIPPSINHNNPNSAIDFKNSPFYFNTESKQWDSSKERRCGVSSFGISGTNAHVILEEYQQKEIESIKGEDAYLFTLSAHSEKALKTTLSMYLDWLNDSMFEATIDEVCYATNIKKGIYNWRFSVIIKDLDTLKKALKSSKSGISKVDFSYTIDPNLLNKEKEGLDDVLKNLCIEYNKGGIIPWKEYYKGRRYRNTKLPVYPLTYYTRWPKFNEIELVETQIKREEKVVEKESLNYYKVYEQLSKMIHADTGIHLTEEILHQDLFDLGIDSIIILQFIQAIKRQYGVKLEIGQFYGTVSNLEKLTNYIVENGIVKERKTKINTLVKDPIKKGDIDYFVPYKEIVKESAKLFTNEQQKHLDTLIANIVNQTNRTKQITQDQRLVLANNRNVAGFKPETKEITYQIIAEEAKGAKIVDLDNNEYVDLTMGFGVNILGYNPDFIQTALEEELKKGYAVGPMNATAGKVAALISELTGNERVAFYNSGSEAIMVALRLAKATTGREKYVIFKESYHGTFDGILALNNPLDPDNPIPLAPGITDNFIQNAIVLEYGSKESLVYIEENAYELAAVLVEPVQSRRPDIQPKQFLQEIRKTTASNGVALIFDEVISGFRVHIGGAKKWFEIEPDLCTYGKVVGGGMPVGVVAGNAKFMDAVDGGSWQFGDDSYPNKPTTFVAGTFNQHPLTMRASFEMLSYLKKEGNELQNNLNKKTTKLVNRLNTYFNSVGATIKVVSFGSLFRFFLQGGWDLFYQHLLSNKVYVWEGRNCFLSTAHTDEDIEFVYQAIVKATETIMNSGWIKPKPGIVTKEVVIPLSEDQEQLYTLASVNKEASSSFNENQIVDLEGDLIIEAIAESFEKVVNRHEILRTLKIDKEGFHISNFVKPTIHFLEKVNEEEDLNVFLGKQGAVTFDLNNGPFIRMVLVKISEDHHKLLLTTHHLVADGYSIELIWNELSTIYSTEIKGAQVGLLPATSLEVYNNWIHNTEESNSQKEAVEFWKKEFIKNYPKLNLPSKNSSMTSKKGSLFSRKIEKTLKEELVGFSKKNKSTVFNVLFSVYTLLLQRLSNQTTFVVGVPSSGQLLMGRKDLVGQCVKMLPIYISIDESDTVKNYLEKIKSHISNTIKNQKCSFNEILEEFRDLGTPKITTEIDMNSVKNDLTFKGLETTFLFPPVEYAKYELSISIIELEGNLMIDFYYNTDLFEENTIKNWSDCFVNILTDIIKNPDKNIVDISMESENKASVFSAWNTL